ncbi:selenium-dependent molybdenum cofactor biosynthesis protein YqeB [Endozoicomonas gorgoniicola]|uniref:Selenium-dependent molybdenum cofactor biosynthesis protein YqeB n=1 Tax=Endozoicomonas gorgoniicola TaxID=1234144 RepID=A0ABT3MQ50_9GAMM|nr:selenium-dependent molybdenum cofactor biosynthesis protein YqeB [Endozoicomonas gorgoniicola]MCW7551159.1 selenium-dependent molybdenum cofactor biosynthesis protein YqeB [Endozoicomonas gorgoniicola]
MTNNVFSRAAELSDSHTPFAIASIIETSGSAPRHKAQLLVEDSGQTFGTVGGGMVERHVIEEAIAAIKTGQSRMVDASMSRSGKNAMGMDCGGAMKVFIDVHNVKPQLLLIGAGHVNQEVAHLAGRLGFAITVADSWKPNLTAERFPEFTRLVDGDTISEAIAKTTITPDTQVVIATNHEDIEALMTVLKTEARHIGQLASRKKVTTLKAKALETGISPERFNEVRTPVGLDLGAETPEEIAVSIMSEILAISRHKKPAPMGDMVEEGLKRRVVIRGAGDLASGVALKLHNSGYDVIMLDLPEPTVIRTNIAFAQALVNDDRLITVEGVTGCKARSVADALKIIEQRNIAVMADPDAASLRQLKPAIVVDAILAKRNLGTHQKMAPVTLALGPGFTAGKDVDAVIETCRGHDLGRIIYSGEAKANTGTPGVIGGYGAERVLRSPCAGVVTPLVKIGDLVCEGQTVATVGEYAEPVITPISGKVRGMINPGLKVSEHFKIGDVDPRGTSVDHSTTTDKARTIAGGVLEAVLTISRNSA